MAEKVKVPVEVDEAFKHLKEIRHYLNDSDLLIEHVEAVQSNDWFGDVEPLNKVDAITFARMLIDGYEVDVFSSVDEEEVEDLRWLGKSINVPEEFWCTKNEEQS